MRKTPNRSGTLWQEPTYFRSETKYGAFGRKSSQSSAIAASPGVKPPFARPENQSASTNGTHARQRFQAIAVCSELPVYRTRTTIIASTKSESSASETTTELHEELRLNGAERTRTAVGAWGSPRLTTRPWRPSSP